MKIVFLLLFAFIFPFFISAQSTAEADSLFKEKQWAAAAKAYEKADKKTALPDIQRYRLGICYYRQEQYEKAINNIRRSSLSKRNPMVMYNMACAFVKLNQPDSAFAWLDKSLAAGNTGFQSLQQDTDLLVLHSDARFDSLVLHMKIAAEPCAYDARYREFDFWIGEWVVTSSVSGNTAGTSSIQLILGSCVILENWTDGFGNQGKSFNTFNASTGKWMQTWVDDKGTVTEFIDGTFSDNAMRFTTKNSQQPDGSMQQQRLTFFKLESGQVRQLGEKSTDGGKTWTTQYDLVYTRK